MANIKENLTSSTRIPNSKVVYVTDAMLANDFKLHDYIYPVGSLIRK